MIKNVGSFDRLFRAALGVVLMLVAGFGGMGGAGTAIAAIVGVVMLATSAMSFCPLYRIVGLSTCPRR